MSYISGNFKYILKQNIKVQNGYAKKLLLVRAYDLKSVHWFSSLKCGNRKRVLLFVNPIALSTDKQFVTAVLGRAVRHALKLRYWVLGGAVGGGVQASRRYEEWKDSLPDMGWIKELIPEQEKMDEYYNYFQKYKNMMNLPEKGWLKDVINKAQIKTKDLAEWLDEYSSDGDITSVLTEGLTPEYATVSISNFKIDNVSSVGIMSATASPFSSKPQTQGTDKLVDDALQIQIKYQKEIDRLEKENRELRKQLLLKYPKSKSKKKFKKSLIDLYSEVLDELSDYDSNYDTQDHLPRVVVVGDQSSGKTSVLEMVAKARIFPRGSGEMMTRAPVKVTLSEGPYHVAQFNDSTREYDLTVESELAELRNDVEMRMKRSVGNGKTVSNQVISMSVKGPGIQRMVLVDLPGIISTVTVDMAADTRESIREMSKVYMSNPNAIILCIQDGSVDAERSNVTELVSQVDPHGKRTILVLTKVDLAEENLANPDRIKKILQGKLFPMKALGNFAVVTGRGNSTDSIDTIKKYEEEYFSNSKLFKDGLISTSQLTTQSLSFAVAECFWKMVKESIEQQADAFKASRFNLETEWKHNFPRERELDRDELFEKARSEILDEVASLSLISAKDWENALSENIWEKISTYVFNDIYFPTAQCDSPGVYNMTVDIKLRQWAEELLPTKCIDVGSKTLMFWFKKLLTNTKLNSKEDQIFNLLKLNIIKQVMDSHQWESKGLNTLRILQLNSLEDQTIGDKQQWDDAVKFLDTSLHDMIKSTDQRIREMIGPSSYQRWTNWQYQREDEKKNAMIKQELEKLLKEDYLSKHGAELGNDEVTMVKKNLQTQKVQVDTLAIKQVWHPVYRMYFLKKAAEKVNECRKCFYLYQQGLDAEIDCNDIILFGRILRMLNVTTNTLRQQLVNREARQIEKIIKDILDKLSEDEDLKKELITGRRVELAEELKQVRRIQDKLEEFIQALNLEK